jgi:hypothetical protein
MSAEKLIRTAAISAAESLCPGEENRIRIAAGQRSPPSIAFNG